MPDRIHVIGAAGRSGSALCRTLADSGIPYVPVVRDSAKWRALGLPGERRAADLTDGLSLADALGDARVVVSCAHARHTAAILAAAPDQARFVLLGSTRRYTRWPDGHGIGVQAGEAALLGSGRSGVMLHPTMIYGAQGEDNVQRLAALLRRLPVVPLPGGGRALVQPIHQDDVTRCILAATAIDWPGPRAVVIAGPAPLPYADFVRAVARAAGQRRPRIMPVPAPVLMALAPLTGLLPFVPRITAAEIRRLLEDKAFPIDAMLGTLGVRPIPLEEGLARTFPS
ncbi:NAD(P)H-binding protein [Limobrevibacterium gyesilva]|uniref:NAD(P)H-binding protein n=1 Tax=Limobrevibacterium gyesilva TaxID=2991712 RepID=A0AA41YR48_9PROT|nr:NAD(P)H-binding protein [Limobrevibacterium gyesilva]MCW3474970.1 NAD(P)H-binding protein [Limobrevibacterium gyesilva]